MGRVLRMVSVDEQREAGLRLMLVEPARRLDLFRRVPELAARRGYPPDGERGYALIIAAIGAYKIGARGQCFKIPPAFLAHERWFALVAQYGEAPSAAAIVEALELDELLDPA